MKRALALLLALVMCLSLCACSGSEPAENPYEKYAKYEELFTYLESNDYDSANAYIQDFFGVTEPAPAETESAETEPVQTAVTLTAEQQIVVDAVRAQIQSEQFTQWQDLAGGFMGSSPREPEVSGVLHYETEDFDGVTMDCYLVNISADVGYWVNEEAAQGSLENQFQLFISSDGKTIVDNITTDAGNVMHDTATEEGRITYLLWVFGEMLNGNAGLFMNNSETITEWTADEIAIVNENIK